MAIRAPIVRSALIFLIAALTAAAATGLITVILTGSVDASRVVMVRAGAIALALLITREILRKERPSE